MTLLPLELSILFGNAWLCLGRVAYLQAIWLRLRNAAAPRVLMGVQPVIWLAMLLMRHGPLNLRTAVRSLV